MLQPDHLAPGLTISLSALEDISGGKPESVNKEVSEGDNYWFIECTVNVEDECNTF